MDDHYTTLGVGKTATQDEIKTAYRKLASKHHPDRGGDTAVFQKIQAAYDVLSNAEKRAAYDNPQSQEFNFNGGMPPGFEDIFQAFNMNGFGDIFGHRRYHQPQRNRTLNLQTTITLAEAFTGKELVATIKLPSGKEQVVSVKIPAGVTDGTTLRLQGMGDDTFPNLPRGDVHLTVTVIPDSKFERQGDDLITEVDIDAFDAILGTDVNIETIDGKTLTVTIKPGTQPGSMLGAQGYGMPNMHDNKFKGRLLLKIKVTIPSLLTEEQKQLIRQARN